MELAFTNSSILSNFYAKPDDSISFEGQRNSLGNIRHCGNAAFEILSHSNLEIFPLGKIDLSNLQYDTVTVSEYETRDFENIKYESHKKYIDLQYSVSGKELIGRTNKEDIPVGTPYSVDKDIMLYDYDGGKYLSVTPSTNLFSQGLSTAVHGIRW